MRNCVTQEEKTCPPRFRVFSADAKNASLRPFLLMHAVRAQEVVTVFRTYFSLRPGSFSTVDLCNYGRTCGRVDVLESPRFFRRRRRHRRGGATKEKIVLSPYNGIYGIGFSALLPLPPALIFVSKFFSRHAVRYCRFEFAGRGIESEICEFFSTLTVGNVFRA